MANINLLQGAVEAGEYVGLIALLKSIIPGLSERVSEKVKKEVEKRENFQELARGFLNQDTPDPYKKFIQNRIAEAVQEKRLHPFLEDRIHSAIATIYAAAESIKDEDERKKWRTQAFIDFGTAAADPKTFKIELESIESDQLYVWFRVARLCGIKVWEFIRDDAWPEVAEFLQKHPSAKQKLLAAWSAIEAEIYEREGAYDASAEIAEVGSYRASIRGWMRKQTAAMEETHDARLARGDEETYTTRRGNAEIVHHRARRNRTTLYAVLLFVAIFGTVILFNIHWR